MDGTLFSPPAASGSRRYPHPAFPDAPDTADPAPLAHCITRVLDEIDYGVILLSSAFSVAHLNHAARRELAGGHPLRLAGGHLCARSAEDDALLAAALAASRDQGLRRMLTFQHGERRWMLAVVPMAGGGAGPLSLVVLGKSAACETLSADGFARWYGLTQAEAAVLLALSTGLRPGTIAQRQGVALSTVRTHIARIRDKTGAASIAELLDMIARLPPLVGALRD